MHAYSFSWRFQLTLALVVLAGYGCGGSKPAGSPSSSAGAGGKVLRLEFWHTRRQAQEEALKAICAEYTRAHPGISVEPVYQGGYDDLNKKTRAAIQARALPALSVAYESHVSEYMANDVIRPMDDLIADQEIGLTAEELSDIPQQYISTNRFPQFDDQLLSFPFTKSNLVMYYNRSLLKKAGFERPPTTWDEFEQQATGVTRVTGKPAYAFTVDASTLDGMIYSHGGEVYHPERRTTLFDQAPTVRMLERLQRMAGANTLELAEGDDAGNLFVGQSAAFMLDTSAGRSYLEEQIGDRFDWDVAVIPHGAGVEPVTVMYGPNVILFKASPSQEREAWRFVKYFTSPEVTARWARETGYLPVRKSAVELPEMQEFYRKNPRARHVYEILPMAKGEPNVVGWQEVRKHLEDTARLVLSGGTPPASAAVELKRKADQALAQSR